MKKLSFCSLYDPILIYQNYNRTNSHIIKVKGMKAVKITSELQLVSRVKLFSYYLHASFFTKWHKVLSDSQHEWKK